MKKLVLLSLLIVLTLSGCSISNQDNEKYLISFYVDGLIYHTLETTQNKEIEFPISPTKNNYIFDGWFFDLNIWDEKLTSDYFMKNDLNEDINVYAKFMEDLVVIVDGDMYYGNYPQTLETDEDIIFELEKLTTVNNNNYYELDGKEYKKAVANPYNEEYLFSNDEQIVRNKTYYFKVEPIKWLILTETGDSYTVISSELIDKKEFYNSKDNRIIENNIIYPNNYEYSDIRSWLNEAFYEIAFDGDEKKLIVEIEVDNSSETTLTYDNDINEYTSNNTNDYLYLASYAYMSQMGSMDRKSITTDYARAIGLYIDTKGDNYGYGRYFLRSPYAYDSIYVSSIDTNGDINSSRFVDADNYGVRPVLTIAKKTNESKELGMKIIVNNKEFIAKLYDTTAAEELYDMLPMTISMSDMPHEKYFYLSNRFTTNTYYPNNIEVGDIMLYGSNCLVLFYDSFSSSYSYTRIGKIENTNGFKESLGRGNVTVRLEKHNFIGEVLSIKIKIKG